MATIYTFSDGYATGKVEVGTTSHAITVSGDTFKVTSPPLRFLITSTYSEWSYPQKLGPHQWFGSWGAHYGVSGTNSYITNYTNKNTWSNYVTLTDNTVLNTSSYFNENNPTSITKTLKVTGDGVSGKSASGNQYVGWTTIRDLYSIVLTLNAPPTFDTTQVAFDTPYVYAGYTNARVTVSNLSAKYGGNISSAVLTIGSQTASRADNGDLVIALENGGTFTPTVKVTDSRGQVTTKTLNPITVNVYTAPTVSFSVERTDSTGNINDEGESAVVTAKFNWTDEIAALSAPTIVCKDPNSITVSATPTWYTDRALTMPITDWSQVAEGVDIYCLIDNATHDTFDTQKSYQITITPTDSKSDGMAITQTLATAFYTIDFLAGGHGIAFGQSSSQDGFFCNMDATFHQDIFISIDNGSTDPTDIDYKLYRALLDKGWI